MSMAVRESKIGLTCSSFMCVSLQVNEYLRETMAQEQRVGNALEAKPAGQKVSFMQGYLYLNLITGTNKEACNVKMGHMRIGHY